MIEISSIGLKIIEYSVKATWKKFERNHRRVKVLKDFNIVELKDNYAYKYAFSLSDYGMDKQPAELIKLFAHDDVFNALKNERYNNKSNVFRLTLEDKLHTGGYNDLKKKYKSIESLEPEILEFIGIYDYYENQCDSPFHLRKFNEVQEGLNRLLEENIRKSFDYQAEQYMQHLTENFYDELYKKLELDREVNSKLQDYFHKYFIKQDLYVDLNGETRNKKEDKAIDKIINDGGVIEGYYLEEVKTDDITITPHNPINKYITEWLNDDSRKFLAILGEYGTGKTTLCGFIAHQLATGRLEDRKDLKINDPLKRILLLLPLRNFREEQIEDFIIAQLNRFGIKDISYHEFLNKVKSGKFVIIFDGFDEMASKTDKVGQRINFDKLKSLIEHSPKSKVLLTSRVEYFRSGEEQQYVLQNEASEIIYLKTFNEQQIEQYIKPRSTQPAKLKKQIEGIYDLEDLGKRAVLLEMIVKYLPKIAKKLKEGETILASQLYSFAIEDELMRKIKDCGWKSFDKKIRLEILEKIALLMFFKDKLSMAIPEIREELKQFPYFEKNMDYEIENDLTAFLTFTFLLREPNHRYRISHKSFRDYLVAQAMVKEINSNKIVYFGKARLTNEIIHFINELTTDYGNLRTIAEQTKNMDEANKWQATNAIEVLLKNDKKALKGLQLNDCYIEGINFFGCNLKNTDFSSSTLKKCIFDNYIFSAKLSDTNFKNSILDVSGRDIKELPSLINLNNLTTLFFDNNQSEDISPIQELRSLNKLWLQTNKLKNISPLKGLKSLTELFLSNNQLEDISPIKELKNLTHLYIDYNQLTDISPLKDLKNLRKLYSSNNQIKDISPLKSMKDLTNVFLFENQISDISPLNKLKNITLLGLSINQIKNIAPLQELRSLIDLGLSNNLIKDIKPLQELRSLSNLGLSNNQIDDINSLMEMNNLKTLRLNNNQLTDIQALKGLWVLRELNLSFNQITDISPLENLKNLSNLHLNNNLITDITPLKGLKDLNELYLSNNQITKEQINNLRKDLPETKIYF